MEIGIVMSVAVGKFKSSLTSTSNESLYTFRILSANNEKIGVVDDYGTHIME